MSDADPGPSEVFELERIRCLVELMKEYDLRELDLRQGAQRIRLARGTDVVTLAAPSAAHALSSSAPAAASATPSSPPPAAEGPNIASINSPMVGTFYSRPNPKAAPYVKVGDHIEPDKTICIIEAMKVFNEIPAEVRGRVVAVLVKDEEPVEFGKPLFKIDTTG
jgi:acetyl-CoA carboxylase biotin carboxyl carrier protein